MIYAVCECGAKILVVPDLDEMARSIVAHAKRHAKKENTPEKAKVERCRIEELLTQKVLASISASEIDSSIVDNPMVK